MLAVAWLLFAARPALSIRGEDNSRGTPVVLLRWRNTTQPADDHSLLLRRYIIASHPRSIDLYFPHAVGHNYITGLTLIYGFLEFGLFNLTFNGELESMCLYTE